jgi:predicted MFS family arabinose efflux permease
VLTLTITGIAADQTAGKSPNFLRRFAAVLSIFLGAAVGATLLLHVGLAVPLLLAGAMVLGATLLFNRNPGAALPHRP